MNYIFLLLGNDSFYESIIMSKLVDELPENAGVFCITGQLQTVYFSDNQRILKIEMASDMAANKKIFDQLINEGEVLGIFIFDFHKFFFKSIRPIIQFDLKWLENLEVPVSLIDYLDIFDYNDMGQLYLKNSSKFNKKNNPEKNKEETDDKPNQEQLLEMDTIGYQAEIPGEEEEAPAEDITITNPFWPFIVKLSPPYPTQINDQLDKILYWKCSATKFLTEDVIGMKGPLNIIDGRKNVVLVFSFQMILQSVFENKQAHYLGVIKSLILYLKRLDIEMNLFIIGFDAYPKLVKGTKIKLKSFKLLNHGLYKTLTSYADLIITDAPWHPILLDAAELQIPAGVIGNSLSIQDDGSFLSEFETTDPEIFNELEISVQIAPNIFFPYIAFPLKTDGVPEFTFYEKKFMYYLLDIYYDQEVIAFLGEFLITDAEVSSNLKKRQITYNERAESALETVELLNRLQNI